MQHISIEKISKKEKGITLVALIITVIVLIILAAISINALINGGFINLAVKSTQDYANAQEYESGIMQNYTNLLERVISNLSSEALGAGDVSPKNYGEYVDLGIDLNGENGSLDDWQIFYRDEQNRIFLISADCIPTSKISTTIQSQAGLSLSQKYGLSWQNAPVSYNCYDGKNEANNDKVGGQCIFPDIFLSKFSIADHSTGDKQYINSLCVSKLLCNDIWKNLVSGTPKENFVQYVSGSPTLEMWAKSWNAKYGEGGYQITEAGDVGITVNSEDIGEYGYYINKSDYSQSLTTSKGYLKAKAENEEEKDILYFPHTDTTDGCSGYWLASPSALLHDVMIRVGYNGDLNRTTTNTLGLGLRPIIVLDSEVVLRQATSDDRTFYAISDR